MLLLRLRPPRHRGSSPPARRGRRAPCRVRSARSYDELLRDAYGQESARFFVADDLAAVLREWGVRRPLTPQD
jgi:hypothetical protein